MDLKWKLVSDETGCIICGKKFKLYVSWALNLIKMKKNGLNCRQNFIFTGILFPYQISSTKLTSSKYHSENYYYSQEQKDGAKETEKTLSLSQDCNGHLTNACRYKLLFRNFLINTKQTWNYDYLSLTLNAKCWPKTITIFIVHQQVDAIQLNKLSYLSLNPEKRNHLQCERWYQAKPLHNEIPLHWNNRWGVCVCVTNVNV